MYEYNGKNVIIMSCSNCNCDCKHCYISYSGSIEPDKLHDMVLKLRDRYHVMINGTEPILNKDYYKSFDLCKQSYILTNGLAIYYNHDLINELKKNNIIGVSMSYHYGIQDEISPISSDIIKDIAKLLLDNEMYVRFLCTISSRNYDKILEFCDEADKLGVNSIKFLNYMRQGKAKDDMENALNYEELYSFFTYLKEARQTYSKDKLLIQRNGNFGPDITKLHDDHFSCPAGTNMAVITPSMNVYKCVFLINKGQEIGYYQDGHIWLYKKEIRDDSYCLAEEECNKIKVKKI